MLFLYLVAELVPWTLIMVILALIVIVVLLRVLFGVI